MKKRFLCFGLLWVCLWTCMAAEADVLQPRLTKATCDKQLRDAVALYGRRSIQYAWAMSRMGTFYADSLSPATYDKRQAQTWLEQSVALALPLADSSVMAAEIYVNSIDFSIATEKKRQAISCVRPLYNCLIAEHLPKPWSERARNAMLFMLWESSLNGDLQDLLYDYCLRHKHLRFTEEEPPDWKAVKNALQPDETAVEMISCTYKGQTRWMASVLKSKYSHPKKLDLFVEDSVYTACVRNKTIVCRNDWLFNYIWLPLSEMLYSGGKVYFSPYMELHQLCIEYIPVPGTGTYVCDRYHLHRVLTTAQLLQKRQQENRRSVIRKAALFGNADYGRGICWMPLGNTASEVDAVGRMLKAADYAVASHTGDDCSEEAFLALSGKHTGIIHIATHGFRYKEASDPLLASGLVMAGANKQCGDTLHKYRVGDGMLTAGEIARMDLQDTRLVVLSACQSGLGVASESGIAGLQSALKQAGVQTIIQALWNVNDKATNLLMKEFYRLYLTEGLSVSQAMQKARLCMKRTTFDTPSGKPINGDDPYFWGAFVVVE